MGCHFSCSSSPASGKIAHRRLRQGRQKSWREYIIPIPIKKCINFLMGIGMRDRRSRRNAKHFGGKAGQRPAAAEHKKLHGRSFLCKLE
jgi:hypothetical protein